MQYCMGASIKNMGYGMGLCSHEDSSCCWDDTFVCEEFASSLGSQQEWGYFRMFSIAPYGCSTTWCEYFNTAGRTDSECLSGKDLGSTFSLPAQSCSLAAPQEGQLLFSGRTQGLDRTHCQQSPSHMRNHENLPYHKSRCYLFYLIFQHNHLSSFCPTSGSSSGRNGSPSQTP